MKDESRLTPAVSFEAAMDNYPASAEELVLVAAFLPELLKEMLAQPDTEGE